MMTNNNGLRYWGYHPDSRDVFLSKKWNPSSLDEMRHNILNDLFPAEYGKVKPGSHTFLHDYEETQSFKSFKQGITDYNPYDTFDYYINDFGFRGTTQPVINEKNIAFFGCSFTFGVGLPEEDHFVKKLGDHLNLPTFNFGIPGGSISRIARAFYLITKFQKIDYAVFVLPHTGRLEYPVQHNNNKSNPILINMILNYRHLSPEEDVLRSKLFDSLSEDYLKFDFLRNLTFIETIAKQNNVKAVYTSWDIPVHNLLATYFNYDEDKLLPWFRFVEHNDTTTFKRARDGAHPGRESNKRFVEDCIPYLEDLVNG